MKNLKLSAYRCYIAVMVLRGFVEGVSSGKHSVPSVGLKIA